MEPTSTIMRRPNTRWWATEWHRYAGKEVAGGLRPLDNVLEAKEYDLEALRQRDERGDFLIGLGTGTKTESPYKLWTEQGVRQIDKIPRGCYTHDPV